MYVCVCTVYFEKGAFGGPEAVIASPGIGLKYSYELPCMDAWNQIWDLCSKDS